MGLFFIFVLLPQILIHMLPAFSPASFLFFLLLIAVILLLHM